MDRVRDFSPLSDSGVPLGDNLVRFEGNPQVLPAIAMCLLGLSVGGAGVLIATRGPEGPIVALVVLLIGTGLVLLMTPLVRMASQVRVVRSLAPRLPVFAATNGMDHVPFASAHDYPGALFRQGGDSGHVVDLLRSRHDPSFSIGTYVYQPSGSERERFWGFIAVRLVGDVPHMVLQSQRLKFTVLGSIPLDIVGNQRLDLEGDFPSHFSLFVPPGGEREALYLFTPDLMALFVDELADLHVETVADWLFVYVPCDLRGSSAAAYERLFGIVDHVLARFADRAESLVSSIPLPGRVRRGRLRFLSDADWLVPRMLLAVVAAAAVITTSLHLSR